MFFAAKKELVTGKKVESRELKISLTESLIAKDFAFLQNKYPQVTMGSYPFEGGTSLVFRSSNLDLLEKALKEMSDILPNITK